MARVIVCGLFGVLLGLLGGCGDRSTTNVSGPTGQCSTFVFINGRQQQVTGAAGGTVTVGTTTFAFGPDCSVTTTTTTTAVP